MGKTIVICAMFSHLENKIYTAKEASDIALQCQKEGAAIVHVHIYKLGSIIEFIKMVDMLQEKNGPLINLSVSDFSAYNSWKGKKSSIVRTAALHAGDCEEFSNYITQPYKKLIMDMEQYISAGFIPELCIFNRESAENCAQLNQIFPKKFYTCSYLDYPNGMKATESNVMWLSDTLKECHFNSFAIYNNRNDEILKYIIRHNGHIRIGMEDSIYCGNRKAVDSISMVCHTANLIKKCGYEIYGDIRESLEFDT